MGTIRVQSSLPVRASRKRFDQKFRRAAGMNLKM
jgi:hypothetical protein